MNQINKILKEKIKAQEKPIFGLKARLKALRYSIKDKIKKRIKYATITHFDDRSKGHDSVLFILAGYKEFVWEIFFKRLRAFAPKNCDICILSSGLYNEKLAQIAKNENYSYLATKQNCVTAVLNTAIVSFDKARHIYKMDEDIFVTQGCFEKMRAAYEAASKDYFVGFAAPLITINGFSYRYILERLNLKNAYESAFGKAKTAVSSNIERKPEIAKFFWGQSINYDGKSVSIPHIDELNKQIQKCAKEEFLICPIRFSIGIIYFRRELLEECGMFPARNDSGMGIDEVFLCDLTISKSKIMVVASNCAVGHLSFNAQNEAMREYFLANKERFEIRN